MSGISFDNAPVANLFPPHSAIAIFHAAEQALGFIEGEHPLPGDRWGNPG
jgi:hypothetical protein